MHATSGDEYEMPDMKMKICHQLPIKECTGYHMQGSFTNTGK